MSPIVNRWEVYGAGGGTVWDCQWPGCQALATHRTRRGTGHPMPYMAVCRRHMLEMRDLPDTEAFAVSRARSMRRGHKGAGRWIEPTNDDHFPGGGP